jgi:hypothetical protein
MNDMQYLAIWPVYLRVEHLAQTTFRLFIVRYRATIDTSCLWGYPYKKHSCVNEKIYKKYKKAFLLLYSVLCNLLQAAFNF